MDKTWCFGKWIITVSEQWSYFWRGAAWYDVDWIHFQTEYDGNFDSFKVYFSLLGFNLYVSYTFSETEFAADLHSMVDEYLQEEQGGSKDDKQKQNDEEVG